MHIAVETLGHLLTLYVTATDEQDRSQVGELLRQIQEVTGDTVELAYVDQEYVGNKAKQAAGDRGIKLEVVKLPQSKRSFILLHSHWVVELSLAWMAHFRRLSRDYERLPQPLARVHFAAFAIIMFKRVAEVSTA